MEKIVEQVFSKSRVKELESVLNETRTLLSSTPEEFDYSEIPSLIREMQAHHEEKISALLVRLGDIQPRQTSGPFIVASEWKSYKTYKQAIQEASKECRMALGHAAVVAYPATLIRSVPTSVIDPLQIAEELFPE